MRTVLLGRLSRVLPFVVLALLLGAWALSMWGGDETLPGVLATHLPTAAYCVPALGAVLASAAARSWPTVLAALASVFLAVVQLGGWTLPSRRSAPAAGHRALTWNVEQWGEGGERLGRAVAELEPDVFCLQEARSYASYPHDVQWQAFEAALPGYRLMRYGEMAIGTRWPVLAERRTRLHPELWRRPLLEVELQTPDGGRLRVLNAHLVYTGYYGKRPSAFVTAARERRAQAERILEHLGASEQPTLLCGDLNAPPNSAALSLLLQRLSDVWRERGLGFGMTSSTRLPLRRIDYLLESGLDVGEVRVLEQPLSDHRALTATFALAAGASVRADLERDRPEP